MLTNVPITDEKTEVPVTSMEYFGLTIDTNPCLLKYQRTKLKNYLNS